MHQPALGDSSYASFFASYVDGIDVSSTLLPDSVDAIVAADDVPLDHKLPSPEEQCAMIARKYPAEVVAVDTSNVRFERMCSIRKSLGHVPMTSRMWYNPNEEVPTMRRTSRKKAHGKRRNTIGGIDDKEIKEAYDTQRSSSQTAPRTAASDPESCAPMSRSKSNDLLRGSSGDPLRASNRFAHFRALKQWGKHRLKLIHHHKEAAKIEEMGEDDASSLGVGSSSTADGKATAKPKQKTAAEKSLKQNPLYSSSDKLFTHVSPPKDRRGAPMNHSVKLRASMTRRQRRNAAAQHRDEPNSSSGNWSASSESGRTSVSSEVTLPTKSSASCSSLNHQHHPKTAVSSPPPSVSALTRRRFNTSTSSSITSDETLTRELQSTPTNPAEFYDDETSSMYSCDTEGYFTSFHVDSGLKTLKEEEIATVPALVSTSAFGTASLNSSMSRTTLSVESDYELFGRGSTSTTASSAGTVCTALMGGTSALNGCSLVDLDDISISANDSSTAIAEVKSSPNLSEYGKPKILSSLATSAIYSDREAKRLRGVRAIDNNNKITMIDHNRIRSAAVVSPPLATLSDIEISENSDVEGAERVKRIRGKTLINSTRIPSMCVITPLNSDDEERVVAMESMLNSLNINTMQLRINETSDGINQTVAQVHGGPSLSDSTAALFTAALSPFQDDHNAIHVSPSIDDVDSGEYVMITDIGAPAKPRPTHPTHVLLSNSKTEYVSLDELPGNSAKVAPLTDAQSNVKLKPNANGLFLYDSSSLRYKRSLCTTFKEAPLPASLRAPPTRTSQTKRTNAEGSPPFVDKMAMANADAGDDQHDVYVTLAGRDNNHEMEIATNLIKNGEKQPNDSLNLRKLIIFFQFTEIEAKEREAKSASWPISSSMARAFEVKKVKKKHRFSWELLTSIKSIQVLRKSLPSLKSGRSKSKASGGASQFKTSTPLKGDPAVNSIATDASNNSLDHFGSNTSIPPISASISKSNETTRSTTCSDRLGVPKTSLNDFKRLLLTTAGKKATAKPSAVEQLKLKRDQAAAAAAAAAAAQDAAQPLKILDLSASPKSFATRRMLQSSNSSPFKKTNLASPRSRWKYNTFNKMPIASIPEANAEDEGGSGAAVIDIHMPVTPPKAIVPKPTDEIATKPVIVDSTPKPESMVIETNFPMEENIFLQTEENNFMRGEVRPAIFSTKISQKPMVARKPANVVSNVTTVTDECSTNSQKALETSF